MWERVIICFVGFCGKLVHLGKTAVFSVCGVPSISCIRTGSYLNLMEMKIFSTRSDFD